MFYKRFPLFFILILAGAALNGAAQAKTRFVSDHLVITLRTGQGNTFQIIKTLVSGERLEVVEETDSGYTLVKTTDGSEGWVRTQYLSEQPIAREQLSKAETTIESLREQNGKLKQQLGQLRKDKKKLDSQHRELNKEHKQAKTDLVRLNEIATKPILLDKENRELKQKNITLTNDLQIVRQENQLLKDRSDRDWFIAGAGVLLGGMLLGLIIPKIRWRKKDGWS